MAPMKTSSLFLFVFFALAGMSHGQKKDCKTDQVTLFSKMVTCVTKDHPEYFLTVLTKMDNPAAMEKPEFMCSNPSMMAAVVECLLQYMEGCMPPEVASQVVTAMPSHQTVMRGVKFLCSHRKDFDHPCVTSQLANLMQCFSSKMQAYSHATTYGRGNVQQSLCFALRKEEQCLATTLAGCPAAVASDIMSGLMAFFPAENCHIKLPSSEDTVLKFQPKQVVH